MTARRAGGCVLLVAVTAACVAAPRPVARSAPTSVPSAATAAIAASPAPGRAHPSNAHRGLVPHLQPPSDQRRLTFFREIFGAISPKSVVASSSTRGRVFAQNMMYRHTVTVYDARGRLVKTIPDTVRLSKFGVRGHPGVSHGAPVEAAFSPDNRFVYVSNYSMYGAGFGREGSDVCTPQSAASAGVSRSYVYRISTTSLRINAVYRVGMVPKFLAVTPDDKYLIVSNWCSYTVTVIRLATGRTVAQVPVGPYPRGIAVSRDSHRAYVAVMGGSSVEVLDLRTFRIRHSWSVGSGPRHLVLDPRGRFLYATLNGDGAVLKIDRRTGHAIRRVFTGRDPRSMAIAPDGRTLYVVNYFSNTVSVLRSKDFAVLQAVPTGDRPIGITYNRRGNRVWVALYSGAILVLNAR